MGSRSEKDHVLARHVPRSPRHAMMLRADDWIPAVAYMFNIVQRTCQSNEVKISTSAGLEEGPLNRPHQNPTEALEDPLSATKLHVSVRDIKVPWYEKLRSTALAALVPTSSARHGTQVAELNRFFPRTTMIFVESI